MKMVSYAAIFVIVIMVFLVMVSPVSVYALNFTKLVEERYTREYSPDLTLTEKATELGYPEYLLGQKYNYTEVFVEYESPISLVLWGDANHTKALWEVVDIAKQNSFSIDNIDLIVTEPKRVDQSPLQYHVVMSCQC
jgi:hypothetical protein